MMLSTLTDHQSFVGARRSLLLASVLTIILPAAQITGNQINFLGLSVKFNPENFILTSRIISAYLFWVFSWICISDYSEKFSPSLNVFFQSKIESSKNAARAVDEEVFGHQDDDYEHYDQSIESWWEEHYKRERKLGDSIAKVVLFAKAAKAGKEIFVDLLPIFLVSLFAIFNPYAVSAWIFK